MDSVKEIIKNILSEYAEFFGIQPNMEIEAIFDDEKGHYELLQHGWIGNRRVHGIFLHLDVKGEKIWIQHDGTSEGIATELMAAGISPKQIILAFRSPREREGGIFAVA